MKKIITALALVSLLIVSSCVTSSGVPEKTAAGESAVVQTAIEEKTPTTVIVEVPYTVKETNYFSDGYVESYKVFTFNEDMTVAREDLFDSFDTIIESVVYERISETEVKRLLYNARGELQSWKRFVSNPDGSLKMMGSYSVDDRLQTESEYAYDDEGNKISWTVRDGEGIILSVTNYVYEAGLNTRIEIYDTTMKMREHFELDYNGDKITRNSHFDENGNLKEAIEYVYDSDNLTGERHLRANGSLSLSVKYQNDENGNPVKTEFLDGNGKLKDWNEKEYEYVSKEISIRE